MDFDDDVHYLTAFNVQRGWTAYYRWHDSNNKTRYSRITEDWDQDVATWNTRPAIDSSMYDTIPSTPTIGYDQNTSYDTLDILPFVNYWQENPAENYGYEIALVDTLQPSAATRDHSTQYHNKDWFEFTFTLYDPITISGTVTHCTEGNDDGAIDVEVSGGSGDYVSYTWWRKTIGGGYGGVESGTDINNVDVSSLQDGLYMLYVDDHLGHRGYRYFLVGEWGDTTTVQLSQPNQSLGNLYLDDAMPTYYKSPVDSSVLGGSSTRVMSTSSSTYDCVGLVKYALDFDQRLNFF